MNLSSPGPIDSIFIDLGSSLRRLNCPCQSLYFPSLLTMEVTGRVSTYYNSLEPRQLQLGGSVCLELWVASLHPSYSVVHLTNPPVDGKWWRLGRGRELSLSSYCAGQESAREEGGGGPKSFRRFPIESEAPFSASAELVCKRKRFARLSFTSIMDKQTAKNC